jgi:hypothetical protein
MVRFVIECQEGTGFWRVSVEVDGNVQGRGFSSDKEIAIWRAVSSFRGRRRPIPLHLLPQSVWRLY